MKEENIKAIPNRIDSEVFSKLTNEEKKSIESIEWAFEYGLTLTQALDLIGRKDQCKLNQIKWVFQYGLTIEQALYVTRTGYPSNELLTLRSEVTRPIIEYLLTQKIMDTDQILELDYSYLLFVVAKSLANNEIYEAINAIRNKGSKKEIKKPDGSKEREKITTDIPSLKELVVFSLLKRNFFTENTNQNNSEFNLCLNIAKETGAYELDQNPELKSCRKNDGCTRGGH